LFQEIHSLDNERGCYAGNKYFADFFDVSERQIQNVIASLKNKGFIFVQIHNRFEREIRVVGKYERQHLYIIGKTGTGKTTLLRNLILQHIAMGHGVGVIDPHGDLAEELLNHIPPQRADHLVYFNPGDLEFPIGLNVIGSVASDNRHLVASGIVAAFKGIWRDSWGPRLEYILYNAASALLECRNQTLLGVNRLLTDDHYRAKVIRQVKDPFIRAFWAEEYDCFSGRLVSRCKILFRNLLDAFPIHPIFG
jgi:hypothetical protein